MLAAIEMKEQRKNILDIKDRNKCFESITDRINLLHEAFHAIIFDYEYHVESTWGKGHKLKSMRENIEFRFFSSKFHLELLLREHFNIEKKIEFYRKEQPELIFRPVFPQNPIFSDFEKEISSIFDSIVFHLCSIFDYLSAIVNFIINHKDESITKWSQLNQSCRQKDEFKNKKVAKVVIEKHNKFVNKLYSIRSRLIHERSDIHLLSLKIGLKSGKIDLNFFARKEMTNNFSELRKKSKEFNISVAYVSEWIIEKTIDSIIEILIELSEDLKGISKSNRPFIFYRNPETGIAESVGDKMWEGIREKLNSS